LIAFRSAENRLPTRPGGEVGLAGMSLLRFETGFYGLDLRD
jgi:hypothetical protein